MSLAVAVNSSEQSWTLTADLVVGTRFLKVGSEVVAVIANFPSSVYAPTGEVTPPSVRVERAVGSTSAASHSQGAAITEYADESAFAGAGGATPNLAAVLVEGNDADGAKITGLADPEDVQDAATMAYVNAVAEEVAAVAGTSGLQRVTIDLIAADIATLNSVPVEVVAAPGAGTVIVPVAASFQYKAGAVAFDNVGNLFLSIDVADLGEFLGLGFNALTSQVAVCPLVADTLLQSDVANAALVIRAALDPDGAGDGTARLTVLYYVMDLLA